MKKVLLCLLLVISLLLIPMAVMPMVGANPPPASPPLGMQVAAPAPEVTVLAAAERLVSPALPAILLVAGILLAVGVLVRKKPIYVRLVSALDRRFYRALFTGGASLRGVLNCPLPAG